MSVFLNQPRAPYALLAAAVLCALPFTLSGQLAPQNPIQTTTQTTGQTTTQTTGQTSKTPTPPAQTHTDAAKQAEDQSKAKVKTDAALAPAAAPSPAVGVLVDRVIAVVNGDPILESDVQEEEQFAAFEPFSVGAHTTRDELIERLIDRQLILQQAKLQQSNPVTDGQAEKEIADLRKQLPACKQDACETDAGWQRFLHEHGFTDAELLSRWKQRMQVLNYIELRFRAGILITPAQIDTYYRKTMLPEYVRRNAKAPPESAISNRIQEVLLQQQVSSLLADWLKSLKAEGSVRLIKPDEANA